MMNYDDLFEKEDPRAKAIRLMKKGSKGGITGEDGVQLAEVYQDLCKSAFIKTRLMADQHHPFVEAVLKFTTADTSLEGAQKGTEEFHRHWEAFSDVMLTLVVLRSLEHMGGIKEPFTIKLEEKPECSKNS